MATNPVKRKKQNGGLDKQSASVPNYIPKLIDSGVRHTEIGNYDYNLNEFVTDEEDEEGGEGAERVVNVTLRRRKGKDGRFLSVPSSSTRKKEDTSWLVNGAILGGPDDGSVIPSFLGHVASSICRGEYRNVLRCQNRPLACNHLRNWYNDAEKMPVAIKELIGGSGLAHLPMCMFSNIDGALISAFVERWQSDTNTSHLPFGEMTIMLHDVWYILTIPVEGRTVMDDGDSARLQSAAMEMLGVSLEELLTSHWHYGGVEIDSILSKCRDTARHRNTVAAGWMWLMLGTTLFVDKSGSRVKPSCVLEVKDGLDTICEYSWGSATLAYLYRQLGIASRGGAHSIAGCLTLLQTWIYEYFPCFRPQSERLYVQPGTPRACTWSV